MRRTLDVPVCRQEKFWSCGAGALRSVLAYYGRRLSEATLRRACRSRASVGTTPEGVVFAAARYGVVPEVVMGASLAMVEDAVRSGRPVMLALQAWADDGRPRGLLGYSPMSPTPSQDESARDGWQNGHWVTLIGVGDRSLIFADPASHALRSLTRRELMQRWHDYETGGTPYYRLALIFPTVEPRFRCVSRVLRMG